MTTPLTETLVDAKGDVMPAAAVAGGKAPAVVIKQGTNGVDEDNPLWIQGLMTLVSAQLSALTDGDDAIVTAITNLIGTLATTATGAEVSVDDTALTALTAAPGEAITQVQELAEVLNTWIGVLKAPPDWPGSGTQFYVDRARVWFGGLLEVADYVTSPTIDTLPTGARPSGDTSVQVRLNNDQDGTPAIVDGFLSLDTDGALTFGPAAGVTLTGRVNLLANGLSLRLTVPA